jgi:hypothetical protein
MAPRKIPGKPKGRSAPSAIFLSVNLRKVQELEGLKRQQLIFKIGERALQLQSWELNHQKRLVMNSGGLGIDI